MELDRFDIYWIHNIWDVPKWTEELAKYFEGISLTAEEVAELEKVADSLELTFFPACTDTLP